MEYCGGGSVADLMNVTDEPLEEYQIAYICREALKVLVDLIDYILKLKFSIGLANFDENYIWLMWMSRYNTSFPYSWVICSFLCLC